MLDYRWKNATIAGLARRFSVAPHEVGEAVGRQYDRAQALAKRVERLSAEALDYEAKFLIRESLGGSPAIVARSFAGRPFDEVKGLAARITSRGNAIALLASSVDGALRVVFARSDDVQGDMNGLMKSTMAAFGGRGGGTPMAAQGGVTGTVTGQEIISYALQCLKPRP